MKVAKKDVIKLHYTGKIKETGEIFDTTYEDVAKEAGIYNEKGIYGPVPIAVGAGHVIKGLDEAKAFGKRDPKLIKTFTIGQFRRQGIYPFPGLDVEIETDSGKKLKGRVMSVSSGRVRVDFNHPFAGKTAVYEVEILEKIEDPIEKVKADFGEQILDPRTLVLGEILLESDLKFLGYEKVEFKPTVEELLKPPEAKAEEEETEEAEKAEEEVKEEKQEENIEEKVTKEEDIEKTEEKSEE